VWGCVVVVVGRQEVWGVACTWAAFFSFAFERQLEKGSMMMFLMEHESQSRFEEPEWFYLCWQGRETTLMRAFAVPSEDSRRANLRTILSIAAHVQFLVFSIMSIRRRAVPRSHFNIE